MTCSPVATAAGPSPLAQSVPQLRALLEAVDEGARRRALAELGEAPPRRRRGLLARVRAARHVARKR